MTGLATGMLINVIISPALSPDLGPLLRQASRSVALGLPDSTTLGVVPGEPGTQPRPGLGPQSHRCTWARLGLRLDGSG